MLRLWLHLLWLLVLPGYLLNLPDLVLGWGNRPFFKNLTLEEGGSILRTIMAREIPNSREVAVYMQLLNPNRHDRRRLKETGMTIKEARGGKGVFEYKEFSDYTHDVRLIKAAARFTGKFMGWAKLGNWDWITELTYRNRHRSSVSRHFEEGSGSAKHNMVLLKQQNETLPNPSQAEVFRMVTGSSDKENPFC